MKKSVAVIGAGYAGLAAAVELAQHNIPVTVYESAKELGGRARRVSLKGLNLDNGQHILIGAYRETLRLIKLVTPHESVSATKPFLRIPLELTILGHFNLKAAPFPKPLHLAVGLMAAQGLSFAERLRAVSFMLSMRSRKFKLNQDISVFTLLQQFNQTGSLEKHLWTPLCISALNTLPETASAQVFLNVLRDSLNGDRNDADLIMPGVDLSELFPDHAAKYIEHHGGQIFRSTSVISIEAGPEGFALLTKESRRVFSHVICAVPPQRIKHLISNIPELAAPAELANNLTYQPIYTLYLQYSHKVSMPKPMQGLASGFSEWVFDRGQISNNPGLLAVVISAEGKHQLLSHDELANSVHKKLKSCIPDLTEPLWYKVIAEKRATFSCTPNLQRPEQITPLKQFYLAGDYTAGDYPATIEAATQSGVKCAKSILEIS